LKYRETKAMPTVTVRLNGGLSRNGDATYRVPFRGKRVKLEAVLSKMPVEVPERLIAFFAVNGAKSTKDSWVNNGDIIDIFPVVAGG
jgi:hypothetical protein